mgnify:CR=1 FL=1
MVRLDALPVDPALAVFEIALSAGGPVDLSALDTIPVPISRMDPVYPASARARGPKEWLRTLAVYREPPVVRMLFLGFSAGLPLLLVFGTLSFWLREAGIDRTTIGFMR